MRGDGSASGGLALFAYTDGKEILIAKAGKLYGQLRSAFLAELLSLEWCLDFSQILCIIDL